MEVSRALKEIFKLAVRSLTLLLLLAVLVFGVYGAVQLLIV